MRIATLILSLALMAVVLFQSFAVGLSGGLGNDPATSRAAYSGGLIALLYLVGAAFVLPFPLVSTVVFVLGGLVGIGAQSDRFADLPVWGGVSFAFAVMSFVGWLGKRRAGRAAGRTRRTPATT